MIASGSSSASAGVPAGEAIPPAPEVATPAGVSLFVILHAFSSGSTALTGVEAISNGVPAFRRPQAKNAAETLADHGRDRDHDVPRDLLARDPHPRTSR